MVVFVPTQNPDGRERFINSFEAGLGAEPNPRPVGCLAIPAGCDVERATRAVKAAASSFAGYLSSVRAALLSA